MTSIDQIKQIKSFRQRDKVMVIQTGNRKAIYVLDIDAVSFQF